jgi:hypothetical protein
VEVAEAPGAIAEGLVADSVNVASGVTVTIAEPVADA